jgi:hypothetical protein
MNKGGNNHFTSPARDKKTDLARWQDITAYIFAYRDSNFVKYITNAIKNFIRVFRRGINVNNALFGSVFCGIHSCYGRYFSRSHLTSMGWNMARKQSYDVGFFICKRIFRPDKKVWRYGGIRVNCWPCLLNWGHFEIENPCYDHIVPFKRWQIYVRQCCRRVNRIGVHLGQWQLIFGGRISVTCLIQYLSDLEFLAVGGKQGTAIAPALRRHGQHAPLRFRSLAMQAHCRRAACPFATPQDGNGPASVHPANALSGFRCGCGVPSRAPCARFQAACPAEKGGVGVSSQIAQYKGEINTRYSR